MIDYMLDTNICIHIIKCRPLEALDKFNSNAGRICISSITLAELLHGAEKSNNFEKDRAVIEDFVSRLEVSPYDNKAASHYGNIRASLEEFGAPIADNNAHIAAHARSKSLVLVTNDEYEFKRISGLRVENWV